MPSKRLCIVNKLGLHARAAAKFVGVATRYSCEVRIGTSEGQHVDGKSIMQVMMLAAGKGTEVWVSCEGQDADQALEALEALINDYFEEGE